MNVAFPVKNADLCEPFQRTV